MYTNGVPGFRIYDEQGDRIVYMYSLEQMSEKTVLFRRTFILFDGSVPHVISRACFQNENCKSTTNPFSFFIYSFITVKFTNNFYKIIKTTSQNIRKNNSFLHITIIAKYIIVNYLVKHIPQDSYIIISCSAHRIFFFTIARIYGYFVNMINQMRCIKYEFISRSHVTLWEYE